MVKKSLEEQKIIELLQSIYGIQAQSAQKLSLGADINACVYKANTTLHSFFVKIKYGNHDDAHMTIIRLLHEAGIKEIIFPIATIEGELFKQLEHFKIIVYPFIEATNGFEQKLTKTQWVELGKILKIIHSFTIPDLIQKKLRKELFSIQWRQRVRALYSQMEPDPRDNNISLDFKKFFKASIESIYNVVNSADELVKKINHESLHHVLCHSDIHAGNVLFASDDSFYLIDWDEPMMAPKERDLMFIGGGVGNVWNSSNEMSYFYEGYGEPNIDKTVLSYYRHERIVEDLALFMEDILSSHLDEQAKIINLTHFKAMFEPNGVVDIALNGE